MIALSLSAACVPLQTISAVSNLGGAYYAKKLSERPLISPECQWTENIYLEGDISGLTDEDMKKIVKHNEIRGRICGSGS